jgi:hypothetical protein
VKAVAVVLAAIDVLVGLLELVAHLSVGIVPFTLLMAVNAGTMLDAGFLAVPARSSVTRIVGLINVLLAVVSTAAVHSVTVVSLVVLLTVNAVVCFILASRAKTNHPATPTPHVGS